MKLKENVLNEVKDSKVIVALRDIVDNKQAKQIKDPVTGKRVKVDSFSASAIIQTYNELSDKNKKQFAELSIPKMQKIAMKLVKK